MMEEFAYDDLSNFNHDEKIAIALGNLIVTWAYAEATLSFCLAEVFQIEPNMAIATYYRIPTFESRVKFLLAAFPNWVPQKGLDKDEIEKAIGKLSKLAKTRNDWIHNVWCVSKKTNETVIFDYRKPLGERKKVIKAHDIEHHCKTVRERSFDLQRLVPGYATPFVSA